MASNCLIKQRYVTSPASLDADDVDVDDDDHQGQKDDYDGTVALFERQRVDAHW